MKDLEFDVHTQRHIHGAFRLPEDPRIRTLVERISCSPTLSLTQLATEAGLSASRLSHIFREQTGVCIRSFKRALQLEAAMNQLAGGEDQVKAVGYDAGYAHTTSFTRAFKSSFGVVPSRFRRSHSTL